MDLTNQEVIVENYAGGHPMATMKLPMNAPLLNRIEKLLKDNQKKWNMSFISYAPGMDFRGETFTINIQRGHMIVNYSDSTGSPSQKITDLTEEEYNEIARLFQEAMKEEEKGRSSEK